jgi:hypothetical protein
MERFIFADTSKKNEVRQSNELRIARGKLARHLRGIDLGSIRFKAFADCVDRMRLDHAKEDERTPFRTLLIEETVRQRKNEIPGYQREYNTAFELVNRLYNALIQSGRPFQEADAESTREVGDIKEATISKAGRPNDERRKH